MKLLNYFKWFVEEVVGFTFLILMLMALTVLVIGLVAVLFVVALPVLAALFCLSVLVLVSDEYDSLEEFWEEV